MFSAAARGIPSFGDLAWHAPVRHVAYGALSATTLSPASGVSAGQTLTKTTNGAIGSEARIAQLSPGIVVGDRILVTAETSPKSGIWTVTALGSVSAPWVLTRATDADTIAEIPAGSIVVARADNSLWVGDYTGFDGLPTTITKRNAGAGSLALYDATRVLAALAGKAPVVNVFTANGTWNVPSDLLYAVIECIGGGGAGGGAPAPAAGQSSGGGGGGGGGYACKLVLASAITGPGTVTVGAGGTGVSAGNGNAGGNTSVALVAGGTVTGNGGGGGLASAAAVTIGEHPAGGAGGAATGGDTNTDGQGGRGGNRVTATLFHAGNGGSSHLGGGAREVTTATGAGVAGGQYGGGGSGAAATAAAAAQTGGAGGVGVVRITEFYGP